MADTHRGASLNSVVSATGTAPSTSSGVTDHAGRPTRRRSRGNFDTFLHAADHAAEEPEPARSARHQPVHPATRAVRRRRAADQHEPAAHLAGHRCRRRPRPPRAMSFLGSTATVDGTTTKLTDGAASWSFSADKPSTATINIKDCDRRRSPTAAATRSMPGAQNFNWDGRGNNGTQWPDGDYTLSVTAKDASGNSGRGLDRGQRHGRQRRPDAEPAGAHDRRAELLPRQDQAGRAAGPLKPPHLPRLSRPSPLAAATVGICFLFSRRA